MALPASSDLPPSLRFVPPNLRSHSRSPSRSPNRKTNFSAQELDPLLNNLSPDSTLSALQTTEAISPTKQEHDILSKSIRDASPEERALGIRAALAAQKLKEWCAELSAWSWPDPKKASKGKGFELPENEDKTGKYLGCLTVKTVATYEDRIEEIKDGLEALDVDELKHHVLSVHVPSRSRPSSSNGQVEAGPPALTYVQLRDFTAVITATIVQALPFLAKLTTLLASWDTRLIVLQQIPILLKYLRDTGTLLDGSLKSLESDELSVSFTREQFLQDREALADSIADLGAKFDRVLDTLEGRDDALPENWIDKMDKIEADFASWVVEAERIVLYNEWIERNGTNKEPPPELLSPAFTPASRASPAKLSRANSSQGQEESKVLDIEGSSLASSQEHENKLEKVSGERPNVKVNVLSVHQSIRRLRESAPHAYTGTESPVSAAELNNHFETQSRLRSEANSNAHQGNVDVSQTDVDSIEKLDGVQETKQPTPTYQEAASNGELHSSHDVQSKVLDDSKDSSQLQASPGENGDAANINARFPDTQRNEEGHNEITNKPKRPTPLLLPHQFHKRDISNVSAADSVLSDTYTDLSSAEIMEALTAEVVGTPVFDPMPRRASVDLLSMRKPTSDTIQTINRPQSAYMSELDSPSSESMTDRKKRALSLSLVTLLPKSGPDETSRSIGSATKTEQQNENFGVDREEANGEVRRASPTPIETVSNNQIRNIVVGRRGSNATSFETPFSPSSVYSRDAETLRPSTADSRFSAKADSKSRASTPSRRSASISRSSQRGSPEPRTLSPERFSPPAIPRRSSRRKSQAPQIALFEHSPQNDLSLPNHAQNTTGENSGALRVNVSNLESSNQAWSNSHSNPASNEMSPSIYSPTDSVRSATSRIPVATTSVKKAVSSSRKTEDKMDEKISSILTTVPMKIKLASEPSSPTEDTLLPHINRQTDTALLAGVGKGLEVERKSSSNSASASTRSSTPTPSLTLTPARRARTSQSAESDIRLYHLHRNSPNQSKDAPPMKLFVRLVGQDGERVMVRVGGGWADLGEYLREYAQHHGGSRRVSGNQFEVQNFPTPSHNGGATLSQPPNNLSMNKTRPSVPPRPTSLLDLFDLGSSDPPARSSTTAGINTHRSRRSTTNATIESPMPSPALSTSTATTATSTPYSHRQSNASPSSAAATSNPSAATLSPSDMRFNLQDPAGLKAPTGYTPLGASGPKPSVKSRASSATYFGANALRPRSTTPAGHLENADFAGDEKWVDEMVGKARRISGGQQQQRAISTIGTPGYVAKGRKASTNSLGSALEMSEDTLALPPSPTPVTIKGGGDASGNVNRNGTGKAGAKPKSKSSIGGIRRVFLRKKDKP
ncbi:MAG: hypothetical protein Q9160_000392 [Pyrenula sp. 1 TL-2023]